MPEFSAFCTWLADIYICMLALKKVFHYSLDSPGEKSQLQTLNHSGLYNLLPVLQYPLQAAHEDAHSV